ncbi:nicotinate-nucleotide adenylyltransferase [Mesomycoplasma lagogenitalium]|uniref:Probable nicotinate-nucleotide adenylyltransferase n=1 Tax=Mesomycoplasma lagogenitalium TaxID=171286 RepID=A0ABY8LVD5_9BACT|nr:nicotinate-nucleotide adenylyltransferase [Mesomycoplasma lagogenitalium]WGI36258.1 nicotinate-nucleotide adenylyltransferase [Mesomycoplasma lagogenitalium]
MKIGIFGGSFDPIHKAHIKIAKMAIEKLNLDKLFFVPAFKSPFKQKQVYAPWEDRVKMIEMVKPEKSEISLFEIKRKGVSYTIDTVNHFKKQFPNQELFLIIGSDNVPKLHKWKEIETIAQSTKIVVFKRDKKVNKENLKKFNCILLENEIYQDSSTEVKFGNFANLEDSVIKYIGKNFLYILDIINNTMDAKLNKHCRVTAQLAADYAKFLNYDAKIAWFSGLVHDLTKRWPIELHRQFLTENNIDEKTVPDYKLHQTTASLWLDKYYRVQNPEIVRAISVHTSLDYQMDTLDKIVFMADKLCQGRKWEGIQKVRKLAFENFDKAFQQVINHIKEYNLAKVEVSQEQVNIYDHWLKKDF